MGTPTARPGQLGEDGSDQGVPRATRVRLARQAMQQVRVLDMTDPEDNPELRRAMLWAGRGRVRPKGRTT